MRHSEGKRADCGLVIDGRADARLFSLPSLENFNWDIEEEKLINDVSGSTMPLVLSHITPDRIPETLPQSRVSLKLHTDITQRQREAKQAGSGHMIGKTSRIFTFNVSVLQNKEHNVRRYLYITVINMCIYNSVSVLKCSIQ